MRFKKMATAFLLTVLSTTFCSFTQAAESSIHVCTTPNPDESSAPSLAGMEEIFWKNGTQLRVKFLNGSASLQNKVFHYAQKWSQYANITFRLVESGPAEVRVRFHTSEDSDTGSWSEVGKNALDKPVTEQTMNLGWLNDETAEQEIRRVSLHEFGHVLGFIHEHQNPAAKIHWNKPVVYSYYAKQGWDKNEVNKNIFENISIGIENSAYDPFSIMHYGIPRTFTVDGFSVGWNTDLSNRDKSFVQTIYPRKGGKNFEFDDEN